MLFLFKTSLLDWISCLPGLSSVCLWDNPKLNEVISVFILPLNGILYLSMSPSLSLRCTLMVLHLMSSILLYHLLLSHLPQRKLNLLLSPIRCSVLCRYIVAASKHKHLLQQNHLPSRMQINHPPVQTFQLHFERIPTLPLLILFPILFPMTLFTQSFVVLPCPFLLSMFLKTI